jgi:NAD(P)H-hydrate epimerase
MTQTIPIPQVLTREQCRRVDQLAIQEFGMSGLVLMENAGRQVADHIMRLAPSGPVLICCGKGNNAGDGFVIARHLDLRGVATRVAVWSPPEQLSGDAAENFQILTLSGVAVERFESVHDANRMAPLIGNAALLVDALLGTGAVGEPRAPYDEVIEQLNASGKPIIAVDLPSGLDCDTGKPSRHTIRAAHTCTFVAAKTGFANPQAASYLGAVHVCDIGAPRAVYKNI